MHTLRHANETRQKKRQKRKRQKRNAKQTRQKHAKKGTPKKRGSCDHLSKEEFEVFKDEMKAYALEMTRKGEKALWDFGAYNNEEDAITKNGTTH